jgi:hypothetical protein
MKNACHLCSSEKNLLPCGLCQEPTCKSCIETLTKEQIQYHPKPPKQLHQRRYCFRCYEAKIAPEMEKYQALLDRANEIQVHKKGQKNLLRIQKREQISIQVKDLLDEYHAIMQLKVLAAWDEYDAILDLETKFIKVRKHGYEHKEWSAKGFFALIKK